MDGSRLTGEEMARIWARVSPAPPSYGGGGADSGEKEAQRIAGFIRSARQNSENYRFMAQKLRGKPESMVLRRMGEEEKRNEKLLRAEYFMLTGDTYSPRVQPGLHGGLLMSLRQQYRLEEQNADALSRAERTAPDGRMAALYRGMADGARLRAEKLRGMIGHMIAG